MLLGAVVIIVTGILVVNYFDGKKGQTISTIETENKSSLPKTHVVSEGEDLWKIAEKYYDSGYNWVDIAKENSITDPDSVSVGEEITIPDVAPRIAGAIETPTTMPQTATPLPQNNDDDLNKPKNVHTVAAGESLWKIAEKYYGSGYNWVDIAKENNLALENSIEIGQNLQIPDVESKSETAEAVDKKDPISVSEYTVVKGDSLWNIALRTYGDGYKWIDIANENNLNNPNIIHPGNILSLPNK